MYIFLHLQLDKKTKKRAEKILNMFIYNMFYQLGIQDGTDSIQVVDSYRLVEALQKYYFRYLQNLRKEKQTKKIIFAFFCCFFCSFLQVKQFKSDHKIQRAAKKNQPNKPEIPFHKDVYKLLNNDLI